MITKLTKCVPSALLLVFAFATLVTRPAAAQQFITIDPPGSIDTIAVRINNQGEIVGYYLDDGGGIHGFSLNSGVYTTIDFPAAISTIVYGVNNLGQIVGSYTDANSNIHGFLLSNGNFTSFDDPLVAGATSAVQIDDNGDIVGFSIDANNVYHSFLLHNGTFTSFSFSASSSTGAASINYQGTEIVGAYRLPSFPANTYQGFTDIGGQFTTLKFPKSQSTRAYGVNNGGQVAGQYTFDGSTFHGFLLSGGTYTTLDFPGSLSSSAADVNDLGQMVGSYIDSSDVQHGYLSTPGPFAYVANYSGNTVSVLDTSTNLIVKTIPVPAAPWAVAMTPDQKHVYVTEYNGAAVAVIDTATNTVTTTVPVGNIPYSLAISPNGNSVFVTNRTDHTVSVISTASNTVVATLPVGVDPSAVAVTPDGTLAYVSNLNSSNLSIINASTNTVEGSLPGVAAPFGLAFTPNGSLAYVTDFVTPGTVAVLSIPSNKRVATIHLAPTTAYPIEVAVTPDGATAYVADYGSDDVSVIDVASNTLTATLPLPAESEPGPFPVAISPDGSLVYVGNFGNSTVSIIRTSNNTVTTIAVPNGVSGIAIASAPPTSQTVTQPLSPTQPNVFSFGTDSQTVQYPPGTNFSNVVMNTVAQQITQAQFQQRVAGTEFATASCIVYSGNGGNCVDYLVTCTNTAGNPITCPGRAQPTIGVETDFSTSQAITNPGYLTTPIGENNWQNIFVSFADPKVKGKTKGFSEFIAVDLGATNPQGLAKFKIRYPATTKTIASGSTLPIAFRLSSAANGKPVTDAQASISVTQIADASGNPVSIAISTANNVFKPTATPGVYAFGLCTKRGGNPYAAGTYSVNIYGNAFAAYQFQFIVIP